MFMVSRQQRLNSVCYCENKEQGSHIRFAANRVAVQTVFLYVECSVKLPWTTLREPATYGDRDKALKVRVGRAGVLSAQVATAIFVKAISSDRTAAQAMSPTKSLKYP